jgi:hypothetical protein
MSSLLLINESWLNMYRLHNMLGRMTADHSNDCSCSVAGWAVIEIQQVRAH